ncbi:MAG TPA: CsgG/HfaB family protein [Haliangium sp.]|nr:CsgG/HfaB family protein [Haliangium sp.]
MRSVLSRTRPRPCAPAVPAVVAVVVVGVVLAALLVAPGPCHAQARADARLRVAVMEFTSASSDAGLDSLGKGLQSMLTTDLAQASALALVERARLQDIESELALGRSGMIDARTAARVGKLAGASHLLGGTFTVHGASMRIDARLFAVETGTVLLAEEITGDKEAFFELEKALVRKLLGALGVTLAPAERTRVAQIHTADFEAFRRFSQGVAHFDEKRYQEAVEALRQATAIDGAFDLARVTLSEYERIAAEIRSRAATIESSRAELERLKQDRQARTDAEVAARLFELTERRGDAHRIDRLTALMLLYHLYGNGFGTSHGRYFRFQDRQDHFAVQRMAAALLQRYVAEAASAFPAVPLFPPGPSRALVPASLDSFDKDFAEAREFLLEPARAADARREHLRDNAARVDDYARHLLLDGSQELALRELVLDKLRAVTDKAETDHRDQREALAAMAVRYRALGDLDRSTALFARQSSLTQEPRELERIAQEIDANRELGQRLRKVALERQLAEHLRTMDRSGAPSGSDIARIDWSLFEAKKPSPRLLHTLMEGRQVVPRQHWFLAAEPCWVILGQYWLLTGERSDPARSRELRYYYTERMSEEDALVACGVGPRGDFDASFTVDFRPAADFWPRHAQPSRVPAREALELDRGRPEVGFVFGLRDLQRSSVHDPATDEHIVAPTRGLMLRFTGGALQLVALGDRTPGEDALAPRMSTRVLSEKKLDLARQSELRVAVRVRGRRVEVTLRAGAGRAQKHTFELPRDEADTVGFHGFHVRGRGYASIVAPEVRAPSKR